MSLSTVSARPSQEQSTPVSLHLRTFAISITSSLRESSRSTPQHDLNMCAQNVCYVKATWAPGGTIILAQHSPGLDLLPLTAVVRVTVRFPDDQDNDHMPDAWERAFGLNPNDPSDAVKDCNGDGYTNIEKYINGIDPLKKIDWTDLDNNYDTLSQNGGCK